TLSGNVTETAPTTATNSSFTYLQDTAGGGHVDLGGAVRTFTIGDSNAAPDVTISAILTNGGVTIAGAGGVVFSGAHTYTGGLTLGGTGNIYATGSVHALGGSANTLTLNGGTLDLQYDTSTNLGYNTTISATTIINVDRATSGTGVTDTF